MTDWHPDSLIVRQRQNRAPEACELLALDFDGVIADSAGRKRQLIREVFGWDLPVWQCSSSHLVGSGLMSVEDYGALVSLAYSCEPSALPPVPGAAEGLRCLRSRMPVLVVTHRSEALLQYARLWLEENDFLDLPIIRCPPPSKNMPFSGTAMLIDDQESVLHSSSSYLDRAHFAPPPFPSSGLYRRISSWIELKDLAIVRCKEGS